MNFAIVIFIIACGFVTAAVLQNAQLAIRKKKSGFKIPLHSVGMFLAGFVFSMFVGPYLVMERGITFWRLGGISDGMMSVCCLVALLWSFCSGVFVTQLLLLAGVVNI
ncbi:MAG: hypothetical protein AAF478_11130 [Pseudomonadota bacterium]